MKVADLREWAKFHRKLLHPVQLYVGADQSRGITIRQNKESRHDWCHPRSPRQECYRQEVKDVQVKWVRHVE